MPAGGSGWESHVRQDVTQDIIGVELQGDDPAALADLWSRVLDAPLEHEDGVPLLKLNNAALSFVQATDGRGAGLSGLTLAVHDPEGVRARAGKRGRPVNGDRIDICGVWFRLSPTGAA